MTNRIVSFVGLTLLFAAVSASAQTVLTAQFDLEFPFVVGSKVLPAATYAVQIAPSSGLLTLVSSAGPRASRMTTHDGYQAGVEKQAALRFQLSGDHWVLLEVMVSGYAQKLIMRKSDSIDLAKTTQPVQRTVTASIASAR